MPHEDPEVDQTTDTTEIEHSNGVANAKIAQLEAEQRLIAITSDPDVRRVIEAKRSGKALKISDIEADAEVANSPADEPGLTDGVNETDPTHATLSKLDRAVDAKLARLTAPLKEKIRELEGVASQVEARNVTDQVVASRAKFKDFDAYSKQMIEISKTTPGLTTDDLYILAKSRAGKLRQAEQITAQEKPTSQPQRRAAKPEVPVARGRKGFADLLAASLDKQTFSSEE